MSSDKTLYTWIPFYEEFADKLLPYKSDRGLLIEKIQRAFVGIGMKLPTLEAGGVPLDIDPFTIFGLFNKGISETNRNKIISGLAKEFGMEANAPEDFAGIPVLMNLNATFYAFNTDKRRGDNDINNLWSIFEAALEVAKEDNANTRLRFVEAYDNLAGQFYLGWKLTTGLFWIRPNYFVSLDSRSRWFVGDQAAAGDEIAVVVPHQNSASINSGKEYLQVCDQVRAAINKANSRFSSLPELSFAAWDVSEQVNIERKEQEKTSETDALGDEEVQTRRYWAYTPGEQASMWEEFYNRGIMAIGWSALGNLMKYADKEEVQIAMLLEYGTETSQKNNTLAAWQFVHKLAPGDVVFVKQGRSRILGCGIVAGDYEFNESFGKYPNIRKVNWLRKGEWNADVAIAPKTLTEITFYPEDVETLRQTLEIDIEATTVDGPVELPSYSKEDFLSQVFMTSTVYDSLVGVLQSKKNVILQGPPGVGKTFIAKRLAYSMMGKKDVDRVMMVQFHQSYSYEDFIEGYRPSSDGFELTKGAFYSFCKKAQDDSDNDYFFIIDEINRGNLSKIFGELFMLIESDKRGEKNRLQLLYSRELFYVPANVYLIGMMNTADRSLALLDYALRRRFAFFEIRPGFDTDGFAEYAASLNSEKFNKLIWQVKQINEAIKQDDSLGEGFHIGHSYFCGLKEETVTDAKLSSIVEYEIIPLLKEYWFDEPEKVRMWSESLRGALK